MSSGSAFRQFQEEGVASGPRSSCRYLRGTKHGEGRSRGRKTRNEAEKDRDHQPVGDAEVIGPLTRLRHRSGLRYGSITGDSNKLEGLGFHGVKLSTT